MRVKQVIFAVMLVAAVGFLMLTAATVRRHSEAMHTLGGIDVNLLEVEVNPQGENPLQVEIEAVSETGTAYRVKTVRMVLRYNNDIVGVRPETEINDEVSGDAPLTMRLSLEPGSDYEEAETLESLTDIQPEYWKAHGFMDVSPFTGRVDERWEFEVKGVKHNE